MDMLRYASFFLLSFALWAKPTFVVSGFDPFGSNKKNNSSLLGKSLVKSLKKTHPHYAFKYCELPTSYDKGFKELESCIKDIDELVGVLSLGEAYCKIKIESRTYNLDDNSAEGLSADNSGVKRNKTEIIANGEKFLGFTLPLAKAFCERDRKEKRLSKLSKNMQTFVCNNTAYLFRHYRPEIPYAFIHVPAHNCSRLDFRNLTSLRFLKRVVKYSLLAHESKQKFMTPVSRAETLESLENTHSECERSYLKKLLRTSDESSGSKSTNVPLTSFGFI